MVLCLLNTIITKPYFHSIGISITSQKNIDSIADRDEEQM
uniref:Uncharacterized protein n=1 Tax=Arundo donax TaxID=35708 RepID=A0A0A9GTR9_ARUDO